MALSLSLSTRCSRVFMRRAERWTGRCLSLRAKQVPRMQLSSPQCWRSDYPSQRTTALSLYCSIAPELGDGFLSWLYLVHFQYWTCSGSRVSDGAINRTGTQQNCCKGSKSQIHSFFILCKTVAQKRSLELTQMESNWYS